jgi:hypothetical protein
MVKHRTLTIFGNRAEIVDIGIFTHKDIPHSGWLALVAQQTQQYPQEASKVISLIKIRYT